MMERKMKDSGIEWIGKIPETWEVLPHKRIMRKIKEICFNYNGEDIISLTTNGVIVRDLSAGGKMPTTFDGYQYVHPGNLLMCLFDIDVTPRCIGLIKDEGLTSPAYSQFKFLRSEAYAPYFDYLLRYMDDEKCLLHLSKNLRSSLTEEDFGIIYTVLPPLSEQQHIVKYLDTMCGEIDSLIALQEQMIEKLKAYKQSVITEAVTKGLNPNAKLVPSGIDWIGEIPEHWIILPIKYVKSKEKNAFVDGPFGSNLKSEHFIENGEVLVIESGYITTGKFVYKDFKTISLSHFETIRRSECKANDIIIAKIGANYGMAGELPRLNKLSVVSGNSLKITLDNSKVLNSIFVNIMFCAKHNQGFINLVQENAQPALSLSGLNNFRIPVPPLSEQHSIASYLDSKCSDIDRLIALKQQKIASLKDYKKSVIYEAVTGKTEI